MKNITIREALNKILPKPLATKLIEEIEDDTRGGRDPHLLDLPLKDANDEGIYTTEDIIMNCIHWEDAKRKNFWSRLYDQDHKILRAKFRNLL